MQTTIGSVKKEDLKPLFSFLVGVFASIVLVVLWHVKDQHIAEADSAMFWAHAKDICRWNFEHRPLLSMPMVGCGSLMLSGFDLENAFFIQALFFNILIFWVSLQIVRHLKLKTPLIWSLCIVTHPAVYLQFVIFEYEAAWYLGFLVGLLSFLKILENGGRNWWLGFFAAFLWSFEARPLEALVFFFFFLMVLVVERHREQMLSLALIWLTPALMVIGLVFFPRIEEWAFGAAILNALILLGLRSGPKIHLFFSALLAFWIALRVADIQDFVFDGIRRDDPGGFFAPLSSNGPGWVYVKNELLVRLMGPLFLVLLACIGGRKPERLVGYFVIPMGLAVAMGLFVEDFSPHYFLAHALLAYIGLMIWGGSRLDTWGRPLATLVIGFQLGVFAIKALNWESSWESELTTVWASPNPAEFHDGAGVLRRITRGIDMSWYQGGQVFFLGLADIPLDDIPHHRELAAYEILTNAMPGVERHQILYDKEFLTESADLFVFSAIIELNQREMKIYLEQVKKLAVEFGREMRMVRDSVASTSGRQHPPFFVLK